MVSHGLYAATEQDKSIGKEFVAEVRRGDLVLRDMGYFSLSEFTAIEQLEAFWLSRLPLTTGVMLAEGRSLEKYLKSFKEDIIDIDATFGEQGKKCRLVAMRAACPDPPIVFPQMGEGCVLARVRVPAILGSFWHGMSHLTPAVPMKRPITLPAMKPVLSSPLSSPAWTGEAQHCHPGGCLNSTPQNEFHETQH